MDLFKLIFPPTSEWNLSDIPDLTGKVALVTGGNTGIGYDTCLALLNANATTLLLCRSPERAHAALDRLRGAQTGKGKAIFIQCDLGSIRGSRQAAKEVEAQVERLDMVFASAGVMGCPTDAVTSDGYELQLGTNVLGHYILITSLLPLLQKTARANGPANRNAVRVCFTSSVAHYFTSSIGFNKNDPELKKTSLRYVPEVLKWARYGNSKLGNVLLANKLHRLYGNSGIVFSSCHPGNLKTELTRHQSSLLTSLVGPLILYPSHLGALTQLFACTSPSGASLGGQYLTSWARPTRARAVAYDTQIQDDLWEWCEQQAAKH